MRPCTLYLCVYCNSLYSFPSIRLASFHLQQCQPLVCGLRQVRRSVITAFVDW